MSDPITFDSTSPRLGLPLLFAGQAQKEVFVNEAFSLLDGLLHCAVQNQLAAAPTTPADGQAWLVASSPSGEWAGRAGQIALRQGVQWLYVLPQDGMHLLNVATGQTLRRAGGIWRAPAAPSSPSGGAVIDSEARVAISSMIAALREAGIFPL